MQFDRSSAVSYFDCNRILVSRSILAGFKRLFPRTAVRHPTQFDRSKGGFLRAKYFRYRGKLLKMTSILYWKLTSIRTCIMFRNHAFHHRYSSMKHTRIHEIFQLLNFYKTHWDVKSRLLESTLNKTICVLEKILQGVVCKDTQFNSVKSWKFAINMSIA